MNKPHNIIRLIFVEGVLKRSEQFFFQKVTFIHMYRKHKGPHELRDLPNEPVLSVMSDIRYEAT